MNFSVEVDPEDPRSVTIADDREAAVSVPRETVALLAQALSDGSLARTGFSRDGFTAEIQEGCLYIQEGPDGIGIDADHIPALITAIRGVG